MIDNVITRGSGGPSANPLKLPAAGGKSSTWTSSSSASSSSSSGCFSSAMSTASSSYYSRTASSASSSTSGGLSPASSTSSLVSMTNATGNANNNEKSTTSSSSSELMPQIEVPDEKDRRYAVLSFDQVKRLDGLMSETISIVGRGNFPTIEVKLAELVSAVRRRLEDDGIRVREIRLNGSGASSVLAQDSANVSYNDLDLIFSVELTTGKAYERVKAAVLDSLIGLLPEGVSTKRMSSCSMKEAYVSKMVKVNDGDRWSLIALGNNRTKSVELKFVDSMRRQYEFSVDSFHILLDTLFLFYDCASKMEITENFYPTVLGESKFGDFDEALAHLHEKVIATHRPEEIRGGGLLKYCNLLVKDYNTFEPEGQVRRMEQYMCSRFFIDFPDVCQQQSKLENYLHTHFANSDENQKYSYLCILYSVVNESTVCLMGHERRLTLGMIDHFAMSHMPQQQQQQQQQQVSYAAQAQQPTSLEDPNLLSPMSLSESPSLANSAPQSSAVSSSATSAPSTAPSSGYATPQKPETPSPRQGVTVVTTVAPPLPPPTTLAVVQQVQPQQAPPPQLVSTTTTPPAQPQQMIPTYEIVTSCQPAVVYSNGYYYTTFPAIQQQQKPAGSQQATLQQVVLTPTTSPSAEYAAPPSKEVATVCPSCCQHQPQQQQQPVQWATLVSVGHQRHQQPPPQVVTTTAPPPPMVHHIPTVTVSVSRSS